MEARSTAAGGRRQSLEAARAAAEGRRTGSMYGFDAAEFDDVGSVAFDVARVADAIGLELDRTEAAFLGRVALRVVDDSGFGSHPVVTNPDDSYVRTVRRAALSAPVSVYDVGATPARPLPQHGLRLDYSQAVQGAIPVDVLALEVAVEPRANVQVGRDGSSVSGGAVVRFGPDLQQKREGAAWYAFVGADAQALTWSLGGREDRELRLEDKQLIGDYQVGVARRLGGGDLSFGFVHREVKANGASRDEQFLGVSYTVTR